MTTITLDRRALKALIDADPDFQLQIKNNVIAEVGRRMFEKDAKKIIAQAQPELFAEALIAFQANVDINTMVALALKEHLTVRDSNWYGRVKLSDETKKLIDAAVDKAKHAAITAAVAPIDAEIQKRIQQRLDAMKIDERIEKRVDRLVEEEIERRAHEKFKERWAAVRAAAS